MNESTFPHPKMADEQEQLFGLVPGSTTAANRPSPLQELAEPLSALCSPESRYKQKYIASQTRVFKKKRTYAGVLDVRIQTFEISTSVRMYLLYCVFPELISSRYGSQSGSLRASDHSCLGLTDSYNV